MNKDIYDKLAEKIFEQNVSMGWWDDMDRCMYQTLQLVSTEVAEATEGERKQIMDDHLTHRAMGEVELADAMIRMLDVGGRLDIKAAHVINPHRWAIGGGTIGKQHLAINATIIAFANIFEILGGYAGIEHLKPSEAHYQALVSAYTQVLRTIQHVADINHYQLEEALSEKNDYNLKRADHKRENRAKKGGKNF